MQQISITYWVILIAIVLALLCYTYYYVKVNFWNAGGKGAEKKTARILSRFSKLRRYKVLSGISVTDKSGQSYLIENMMIGWFGILLVDTLGARGDYYGNEKDEKWVLVQEKKRSTFPNPLQLQEKQKAALRSQFADAGIYKIPIESAVYIASTSGKTQVFVSGETIFQGGKFNAHLSKSMFEKDNNIDIEKLAALFNPK